MLVQSLGANLNLRDACLIFSVHPENNNPRTYVGLHLVNCSLQIQSGTTRDEIILLSLPLFVTWSSVLAEGCESQGILFCYFINIIPNQMLFPTNQADFFLPFTSWHGKQLSYTMVTLGKKPAPCGMLLVHAAPLKGCAVTKTDWVCSVWVSLGSPLCCSWDFALHLGTGYPCGAKQTHHPPVAPCQPFSTLTFLSLLSCANQK